MRDSIRTIRRLLALGQLPCRRLALATTLGTAAALATIGLLAGSGYVIDRAAFRPGLGAIAGLLAAVEVLAFSRAPLRYGTRLLGHDAAFRSLSAWRVWLYDTLEPRSPAGLEGRRSGDLLARAIDDVDKLQDLYLRVILPLAIALFASVAGVILVAAILPAAGLVLLGALLLAVMPSLLLGQHSRRTEAREAELRGRLMADTADLVQCAADLLAFDAAESMLQCMEETEAEILASVRRRASVTGLAAGVFTLTVGAAVIGTLAVAIDAVVSHRLAIVMVAVIPLAVIGTFDVFPGLIQAVLRFDDVVAAGRRLLELEQLPVPIDEPSSPEELPEGALSVTFEQASLRYGKDLPLILDRLDLEIAPHTRVAIMGPSGSGKSTLVAVLLRFWPLASGRALLGNVTLGRVPSSTARRRVALVDQQAELFAGSIADNVALGRPDASAHEIADVLGAVGLSTWVATLPDGAATRLGEAGATVSGGERRRLAIARALLAGGEVLVLDEPTAGLDESTADQVLRDVRARAGERTIILITHRTEDLIGFPRAVVLTAGRATPLAVPRFSGAPGEGKMAAVPPVPSNQDTLP